MALDRSLLDALAAGAFGFIDAGCGAGGSIDYCQRRFGRGPGLGLDWYTGDLEVARRHGHTVAQCDLMTIALPPRCVAFASMLDFLEHLPNEAATTRVLQKLGHASREFLFIRHPSFEDIAYLAQLGLKLGWTDWSGHPNMLRVDDFRRLFAGLGWHDYVIHPDLPFFDSTASPIVPLTAPRDVRDYEPSAHGPKPFVVFDRPVYGLYNIFVRLSSELDDAAWERLTNMEGWRAQWEAPGSPPTTDPAPPESSALESAVLLAVPSHDVDVGPLLGALPDIDRLHLGSDQPSAGWAAFDTLLGRNGHPLPEIADERRQRVEQILLAGARAGAGRLAELGHLLDLFVQTDAKRVLALGSSSSLAADLLAARFPRLEVVVTGSGGLPQPAGDFDLVFALGGLEPVHVASLELESAMAHVGPGGWLYAAGLGGRAADRELLDPLLRRTGFTLAHLRPILDRRLIGALEGLLQVVDGDASLVGDVARLALLDTGQLADAWATGHAAVKVALRRSSGLAPAPSSASPIASARAAELGAGEARVPTEARDLLPLLRGESLGGTLRGTTDFLNGLSLAVENTGPDAEVELELRTRGVPSPLRTVRRTVAGGRRGCTPLRFPFAPIPDSAGRDFAFVVASDETVALRPTPAGAGIGCGAHYGAELARTFDPLLGRNGFPLPPVPARLERYLDRHVQECLRLRRYFFLRLAHLADAIGRIPERLASVLSIGAGVAYQEAFLAGRLPHLRVLATDVVAPVVTFPMPNLEWRILDAMEPPGPHRYDLVFSIECLEHIEDFRRAFRHQAAMVRPGGYLYISVPFASRGEQCDPELRRLAWESFEHYTPGFDFDDLEALFAENDLEILHASNMFFLDVVLPVRRIVERLGPGELDNAGAEIARLLLFDVRPERVKNAREAEGIRFLGRKRAG